MMNLEEVAVSGVALETRAFRLLNVLDDFKREGLGIDADFPLPAKRVTRSLNRNKTPISIARQTMPASSRAERYNRTGRHD